MKRRAPLFLAVLALALTTGCTHVIFFSKKPTHPRPVKEKLDPHVSTAVELEFRQRWVDHRVSELLAQGMTPDAAKVSALAEFRVKFSYTHAAQVP